MRADRERDRRDEARQFDRRRAPLAFAAALVALALASLPAAPERSRTPAKTPASSDLAGLPLPAQATISNTLGRGDRAYHARPVQGGMVLANARHGIRARFDAAGVQVQTGTERLGLSLRAWGFGDSLRPVRTARPRARANRVTYRRGALTEWYANGPLGLEQGFTLRDRPVAARTGPLTLALALTGAPAPRLDGDRRGLTFVRPGLSYGGLVAFDAAGRSFPASLELQQRTVLVRVDDRGARYPLTIDPFLQQAKLTDFGGLGVEHLGESVAAAGNVVVAGAPDFNNSRGNIFVFQKPVGGWTNVSPTARLVASDGIQGKRLGISVAVAGDTVVAGAQDNDEGEVYVFQKPAGGWPTTMSQTAKLSASDGGLDDRFGISVGIAGDTVVAAADRSDVGANGGQGSVYVFQKPPAGWVDMQQTAKLTASDGAGGDNLGSAVAVAGDTIVAAARRDDVGANADQGSVYVFQKSATGWTSMNETVKLTASDGGAFDLFGHSVAVDGDTVVAAAARDNAFRGTVYVFQKPATGWADAVEVGKLTASDGVGGDALGSSVAVAGDTVVAGAPFRAIGANGSQGAAYVFRRTATGWANMQETARLTASDGASQDRFGSSVALAGATLVVGAPMDDVGADVDRGSAYVFQLPMVSIADVSVTEGNAGTTVVSVPVTVIAPAPTLAPITVSFATVDGRAGAPGDYQAASGTLTIPAGATSGTIQIGVVGELVGEGDEFFVVNLATPVNATIADGQAAVTIINDDDTSPPTIEAKAGVVVETRGAPVTVLYKPPGAVDNLDGIVPVSCVATSGSSFPFGTTAVNCTAQDKNGNVGRSTFNVIVRLPTTSGAVTNPGNLDKPLTQVAHGQRVRVTAGGFRPGSSVSLRFVTATGDVIDLGPTSAGSDGRIDVRPKIPTGAPAGASQMTAVGLEAAGAEFVRAWRLTVR